MSIAQQVGIREKFIRYLCKIGLMGWDDFDPASILHNKDRSKNMQFTVNYYGVKYQGRIDSRTDFLVYFFGDADLSRTVFAQETAKLIKYNTGRPFCFYDVGANRGDFSLALANIADSIIAWEQSPRRFSHLMQNIAVNGASNIEAFNVGLSDVEQAAISAEANSAVQNAGGPTRDPLINLSEFSPGDLKRGALFIERNGLAHPDFIRINAGNDHRSVLRGFGSILELSQPIIFIEQPTSRGYRHADETELRSVLYENAKLYAFSGSPNRRDYRLDSFDPQASRIVCYPPKINRMIEQEFRKMTSLRMLPSGY